MPTDLPPGIDAKLRSSRELLDERCEMLAARLGLARPVRTFNAIDLDEIERQRYGFRPGWKPRAPRVNEGRCSTFGCNRRARTRGLCAVHGRKS